MVKIDGTDISRQIWRWNIRQNRVGMQDDDHSEIFYRQIRRELGWNWVKISAQGTSTPQLSVTRQNSDNFLNANI